MKNGLYGVEPHRRQMFRCFPADDAKPHNFAGQTPRFVATHSDCAVCENEVAHHQGPRVARHYEFPVAEAADALVKVGEGMSYTDAADRVRALNERGRFDSGAQLVGNWVEVLGPVVCADLQEEAWPETVVLDSTWFSHTDSRTRVTERMFCVLGAYGYPTGAGKGRTWALKASPQQRKPEWVAFLRSKAGAPAMVICDGDKAILAAVQQEWPNTFVKRCEYHLRQTVLPIWKLYFPAGYLSPEAVLLDAAFQSPADWKAFKRSAKGIQLQSWITTNDAVITAQVKARAWLPQHHSTGALERSLTQIRSFMEPRSFCYRNATRTNRMLELVRASLNKKAHRIAYGVAIRAHLNANGGRLPPQLSIRDRRGMGSLR